MSDKKEAPAKKGRAKTEDNQNGVARPREPSQSALVWSVCDDLNSADMKPAAVIAAVLEQVPDMNLSTIKTQIARWRQYHGLVTPRK